MISMSAMSLMLLVVVAYAVGGLSGALVVAEQTDRLSFLLIGLLYFIVGVGVGVWFTWLCAMKVKPKPKPKRDPTDGNKFVTFGNAGKLHRVGGCDYTAKCGAAQTHTFNDSLVKGLKGQEILCKTCLKDLA